MSLFSRKPKELPPTQEWEYRSKVGYAEKGTVARLLAEGWEIHTATPVLIDGVTFGGQTFLLRRRNPNFQPTAARG